MGHCCRNVCERDTSRFTELAVEREMGVVEKVSELGIKELKQTVKNMADSAASLSEWLWVGRHV